MRAPVIIYDSNLNKAAYLPQAYNVSYEMRANEVGRASFSVPIDDVHVSEITQRRYAEIYDGNNRVELFRIVKITKADNELKVDCEHVLATLTDTELSTTLYGSAGTSTAIGEVLALQSDWQLGTCDFNEQYLYEWPRGTTLLKALLDIPARFQEGYFWTYDTTSHPWTINLISPPTSVTAFIDYGRNMQSIEREEDVSQLVTKLYPHGAKAGADQIGITSVEPSGHAYIEDYSYTTDVITRHWTDQNYTTEQELYDAAVARLAIQAQPKYTYRVTASDLYRITGESIDRFSIGTLVRVINPDLDIESDVRVMSISKGDITGAPGEITLELANKGEEFSFVDVINTNDLSGIDINDIPGGTPGALPGAPAGTGLTITTDYLGYHNGATWMTYMDSAGRFYLGGTSGKLQWDGTNLAIEGSVTITGGSGIGSLTDAGDLALLDVVGNAHITDLAFSKITAATNTASLTIGGSGYIKSSNYSAGYAGFKIRGDGNAEFNNVTVRGALVAQYGSSLNGSYVIDGSLHASKLYIDDDLDFAGDSNYHGIGNIDAIYFRSTTSYPRIWYYSSGLKIEANSGGDILMQNYLGSASFIIHSGGSVVLRCGSDNIEFLDAATTGGQWNLGYINVKINGVSRSIAVENPH